MASTNPQVLALFVAVLFIGFVFAVRKISTKIKQYCFFTHYVGQMNAQIILSSPNVDHLYSMLSNIKVGRNQVDIFDAAITHISKPCQEPPDIVFIVAMLKTFNKKYFKHCNVPIEISQDEMSRYCYATSGFTSVADTHRYLLWLLILHPDGLKALRDLI